MNAQDLAGAADVLAREAKRFEGLAAAAKSLGEASSIVNRVQEVERTLAGLVSECSAERDELAKTKASRHREAEASANDIAQAGAEVASILAQAQAQSESVLQAATDRAETITDDARNRAAGLIAAAEGRVFKCNDEIADKTEVIDGLAVEIAQKSAALADIEKRIASAREKIAAFAG